MMASILKRHTAPGRVLSILLIVSVTLILFGCAPTGGPRPDKIRYANNNRSENSSSDQQPRGLPYIDADFRLAPNDIVGLTFFTSATPIASYPLQVNDTLLVEFHQQEHLNRNLVVPPDGKVTMPYLGSVKVAGRTSADVSADLTARYKKSAIFNDVQITVSLIAFNSRLKELQGANFNSLAGQTKDVVINHDGYMALPLTKRVLAAGRTVEDLKDQIRKVYRSALPGADVDVELRQVGSNYIYVLGQVNAPGMVAITGPMGVTQAVAAAGGFTPGADLSTVAVLRAGPYQGPVGQLVDVRRMLSDGDMSGDVLIRRFDVLYVAPSPIQQLNDGVRMYIRNMLPIETFGNIGFSYMWGDTNGSSFQPF